MPTARWVRIWHRRLGLTAAAFVLLLSVTGILLNHTSSLDLDNRNIETAWILDWYGIAGIDETARAFELGDLTVSWAGGWLFVGETPLIGSVGTLQGAVALDDLIVLSTPREIVLATKEGELVERFLPVAFGGEITSLGSSDGRVAARVGGKIFAANEDGSVWKLIQTSDEAISWSVGAPIPSELVPAMNAHLRGEGLPLYRIILDLHSGKFFGNLGVWIMDGAAVLLLILSISGIWIWWPRAS